MRPKITLPKAADFALKIEHQLAAGFSQEYFLLSDAHFDAPECYIKLLHKHIKEAVAKNALIIDNGDLFDAIGGRFDKRASKGVVVEEVNKVDYLDRLVQLGVDEFEYAADNFIYMGTGNHEQSITIKNETDIGRRFVAELNSRRSKGIAPIHRGNYTGSIQFSFKTKGGSEENHFMKLEHGTGGNSPVTKGVIEAQRRQVRLHGYTFFVSGHIHTQWLMPYIFEHPNFETGRIELRKATHIQLSSYKSDYRVDGVGTWAMQKIATPAPIGGAWLRFFSEDGESVRWEVAHSWVNYEKLQSYLRGKARVVRDA